MNKKYLLLDLLMRVMALLGIGYFAWSIWSGYQLTHQIVLLLLFIAEFFTVCLIIFSKRTDTRDFSPLAVLLTIIATFYFFVVYLGKGESLIPEKIAIVIMISGISLQIISKAYLGRNFGLLPAVRGIVTTGPYRVVRHPIYLGYFIAHIGFLLNSFSLYNMAVYILMYVCQFGRMYYEERKLSERKEYLLYKSKVKYRFIPFIL